MTDDPLLTITETAYRLKVSEKTVYRYISDRRLTKVKIVGSTYVTADSVTRMLSGTQNR